MTNAAAGDALLAEQIAYYRAVAPEYERHALPDWDGGEVQRALAAFAPSGDVLELACGPGMWTEQLARTATTVTAVDAAPEMLARARARVGDHAGRPGGCVRFVQADLFAWRPDRRYDVVFFGFWLSHVPRDRFASFWTMVAEALAPGGRVFFVDDGLRTPDELIEGEASSTIQRRLLDGTPFRAVKVPYGADELERGLADLGWRITVRQESPFYWGSGSRMA